MNIAIRGLHLSFGDLDVLRGVDLDVPAGEISVILGGSGSGKSVLLKLILGLLKPDEGSIKLDGEEITGLDEDALVPHRQRFGVIFQSGGLLQSLTVGENVALGLVELSGKGYPEIRASVREQLKAVGLEGREEQEPSTLSGGQRKRAAIARALTQHNECLLLDEPTAGLDPPTAAKVDDIVMKVNREVGSTCVLVTHDLVSAMRLGSRLNLLHQGRIVASGTPTEFAASKDPHVVEFLRRERDADWRRTG
ncbi:MAG: ATP-binding cassette domain-containing protein [Candidatus Sumerlaeia bacterium]|nr:ATP-binding cassette domain-containing protein [Candidatus Sumerlaeia bacterium]